MFTIDDNIPLSSGNRTDWPFKRMSIGQSVFIEVNDLCTDTKIFGAAHSYGQCAAELKKFKTSRTIEHGKEGVRVWRIL